MTVAPMALSGRPLRVAYVLFQLSPRQAATERLLRLLPMHSDDIEPSVFVSEEFTTTTPTVVTNQACAEALNNAGVPVTSVGASTSTLELGRRLTEQLRASRPDVVVFVGSPACAVQAYAAYARVAPVQINHSIAAPLIISGIDAVMYHHPASARDDAAALARFGITPISTSGPAIDTDPADRATATPRSEIGIPDSTVAYLTVSNRLSARMTGGRFAHDLGRFLSAHPEAWWVGVGERDPGAIRAVMRAHGVWDRCVVLPPTLSPHPIMKACDVYLNEYPEGGCNAVLEAMACGTPAVAMVSGAAHVNRIGAECVGPDAIKAFDPGAYWSLAHAWADGPIVRKAAGAAQRDRVRSVYADRAILSEWEAAFRKQFEASLGRIPVSRGAAPGGSCASASAA